jgi:L-ascorbate metabolism protein UlaG (beta-lactamase superfamily)
MSAEQPGSFDFVLISHDHRFDNFDHAGRAALAKAKMAIATVYEYKASHLSTDAQAILLLCAPRKHPLE